MLLILPSSPLVSTLTTQFQFLQQISALSIHTTQKCYFLNILIVKKQHVYILLALGEQQQPVRCFEVDVGVVDESLCDPDSRPDDKHRRCKNMDCPARCVLSNIHIKVKFSFFFFFLLMTHAQSIIQWLKLHSLKCRASNTISQKFYCLIMMFPFVAKDVMSPSLSSFPHCLTSGTYSEISVIDISDFSPNCSLGLESLYALVN